MRAKQLITLLGVLAGSTATIFVRWSTAPSLVLVVYRMGLTVLLLLPAIWHHRTELIALDRRSALLSIAGGCIMGLHFAAYFQALRLTSIASCAVLANLTVIFVAIGAVVIFRQKLNCRVWAAILSAFGGAIIITLGGKCLRQRQPCRRPAGRGRRHLPSCLHHDRRSLPPQRLYHTVYVSGLFSGCLDRCISLPHQPHTADWVRPCKHFYRTVHGSILHTAGPQRSQLGAEISPCAVRLHCAAARLRIFYAMRRPALSGDPISGCTARRCDLHFGDFVLQQADSSGERQLTAVQFASFWMFRIHFILQDTKPYSEHTNIFEQK